MFKENRVFSNDLLSMVKHKLCSYKIPPSPPEAVKKFSYSGVWGF